MFRIIFSSISDFSACNVVVQPRPMVPKKDIAVYGYGSVAWKDRMEEWKKKQNDKLQVVKHQGNNDGGNFGDDPDDPDLPMRVTVWSPCFSVTGFLNLYYYDCKK